EALVTGGSVRLARTPLNFLARWQQLEYVRAFTAARVAMSHLGCMVLISGAFGLFRRSELIAVGGYRTDTVGEDFELTVRLHPHQLQGRVRVLALRDWGSDEGFALGYVTAGYVLVTALVLTVYLGAAFAAAFLALALLYGVPVSLGTTALDDVPPLPPRRAVD